MIEYYTAILEDSEDSYSSADSIFESIGDLIIEQDSEFSSEIKAK